LVSTAASSCGKDRATRLSGIRPRQRSRKYLATARSTILRCDASAEILGSHCLLESKLRKEHAMPDLKIVENATCTFCGCVCDDMDLTVEDHKITKAKNACVLGKAWFLNHHIEERPVALIAGKPATLDEAIERAAQILANARYPIVYGLSDTTGEAQR